MDAAVWLPGLTSILALLFAVLLFDQWRVRRGGFQLIWAFGMLFYGIAAGAEALAAMGGWNEALYRTWYLTGAVWTAGWLGLGTTFLLGRTRFGYSFALCLFLAGLFTFLIRNKPEYAGRRHAAAAVLHRRRPAGPGGRGRDVLQQRPLAAPRRLRRGRGDPAEHRADDHDRAAGARLRGGSRRRACPVATLFPPQLRLLTPFMNITGAFALILGAVFSTYVFMPKHRVLAYSLDPNQPGDQFLFNLFIAPVAILVNLVASLPGAIKALLDGTIHSRVPATILIAIGAFIPTLTDSLNRFGTTELFQLGKFLGVVFLFAGFLVSIEVFRDIRIPFTSIRWLSGRHESPAAELIASEVAAAARSRAAHPEPAEEH